jgi:2-oxo-3-hexenedioate decarboxylase
MNAQELLKHYDSGACWPQSPSISPDYLPADAYRDALAVRSLRTARGEIPKGYKIGFTNRSIWDLYNVYTPMWGTIWDTTLAGVGELGTQLSLAHICQPRIEPEIVFGFKSTPKLDASTEDLYESIDWIAPGFEIVQSHKAEWKFTAVETILDSGLHARLGVGKRFPIKSVSSSGKNLIELLSNSQARLFKGDECVDSGPGSNVLDSPLQALHYFLKELRACPGATDIQPGDIVTTGTWTDAWPIHPGESWTVEFSFESFKYQLNFVD